MVRRFGDSIIEYLVGSQRFDIRLGSLVRWFAGSIIEYLVGSQRFDIRLGSLVRWFEGSPIRSNRRILANLCIIILNSQFKSP